MATVDANGILFYDDTDNLTPLNVLLNTGQQSVSDALTNVSRIYPVANVSERNTYTSQASAVNPIFVSRADASPSRRIEVCDDGADWRTVSQSQTPARGLRTADATVGISAWRDASAVVTYPFVKDSWYLINGTGSVSIGGAQAIMRHRILASALDVSSEFTFTATPTVIYSISAHLLFQAPITASVNVSHQVYVPSPATGIIVRNGHVVSITKVA